MSFGTSAIGTVPYGDGTGGSGIVYYDISLVSPVDNSTTAQFYPTFTSLPNSSDGSAMQIEWQWDTDPSFLNSNGVRQLKTTNGNTDAVNATTTPDGALYNGPYYWRVRAGNGTDWSNFATAWKLNVPIVPMSTSAYTYENMGIQPQSAPSDTTVSVCENIGVLPGTRQTIVRQPRGWGVIPTGPQNLIILPESAVGTAETYENIQ